NGAPCKNSLMSPTPLSQENPADLCCRTVCLAKKPTKQSETALEERKIHCCLHTEFEFRHVVRSTHIDKSIDAKRKQSETALEERKIHCCLHTEFEFRHVVRSTHIDKSIDAKRKVIRMLFVIIVEFFVCWTPLHVINTLISIAGAAFLKVQMGASR
ncbi:neuropeptide receptor A9, partial [Danaus plexippus plexippus]